MPFKNKAQMRACFAQRSRDLKAGRRPKWNCYKWLEETPGYRSHKSHKRYSRKKSRKSSKRLSRKKIRKSYKK